MAPRYVDEAYLLAQGITITHPEGANAVIARAEDDVDRITGQFFNLRQAQTLRLDGNGETHINLPVPLVSLTSITIDGVEASSDGLLIYPADPFTPGESLQSVGDARMDPHLEWDQTNIRSGPRFVGGGTFPAGQQNIVIVGDWGFVDYDGSQYVTPGDIKLAVAYLIRDLYNPPAASTSARVRRRNLMATSERSGAHSLTIPEWAVSGGQTGIIEVDKTLARYTRCLL